jgi:hypothetical protein
MATIQKVKKQAEENLRVPEEFFIPVDNILKVEDLEAGFHQMVASKKANQIARTFLNY